MIYLGHGYATEHHHGWRADLSESWCFDCHDIADRCAGITDTLE